ncbi:hypothetical protein [Acinetobacter beijerinckii]|uniref:hypothetical protein n=1 Tax=Acinetobacter beijerinckii TaxID=262668 RepID=UPI0040550197
MTTLYTVSFTKTVLASLIGVCLSQSVFALQELSDQGLSEATGEGIALLPQDAYFVFRGAGPNESETDILDPTKRLNDTGYIHYLPVGGLTSSVQDTNKDGNVNTSDHSVGKADIYLYGLSVSKNASNNSNSRLDTGKTDGIANAAIKSWGTASNPWIFKATTAKNVPNFSSSNCSGGTDTSCQVTYLNLEAPLYETTLPTTSANGADAYNLKIGVWADAFVRDQSKAEGHADQFKLGEQFSSTHTSRPEETERANRLRLQGVWNGFSVNGSNLQVFQTLKGATDSGGLSYFYNNTLGLAGILRFNSGTGTTASDGDVLRLSTRECGSGNPNGCTTGTAQGLLASPGVAGSGVTTAPNFSPDEGVFIYNLNTNLVLGSLYQPLILGSDGKNFSLEIARIPNKPEIYTKIYTRYAGDTGDTGTTYYGSTCNVFVCGTSTLTAYQGGSPKNDYSNLPANTTLPTHSSIGIGSVTQGANNLLIADKSASAVGISFGKAGSSGAVNMGSAVIDGLLIQHMKITTAGL